MIGIGDFGLGDSGCVHLSFNAKSTTRENRGPAGGEIATALHVPQYCTAVIARAIKLQVAGPKISKREQSKLVRLKKHRRARLKKVSLSSFESCALSRSLASLRLQGEWVVERGNPAKRGGEAVEADLFRVS